jgi:hypothetical protein
MHLTTICEPCSGVKNPSPACSSPTSTEATQFWPGS